MATKKDTKKLHDYAKLLYTKEGVIVQKELAERVGVSVQTINKWVNADGKAWDRQRSSLVISKQEELARLYMQVTELNDHVFNKPKGQRFSNSKEADTISKLAAAIEKLETETSIREIIDVMMGFTDYVRKIDFKKAQEITELADSYIKSRP